MHAAPPQAKSPLISFNNSKKYLAKISVGFFTKWLQFIFTADGWMMCPFNLPLSAPACCWVPFRLSKPMMESRDLVSVRVSRPVFWSLDLEGIVSVSKDFSPGLELFVSRLCIGYFLWSFARSSLKKTVLQNDCSKFNRSKKSVAKLSFLICCLRVGENNLPSTQFKMYTEFNKNVHVPVKPHRVTSATRGWSTLLNTMFELFFK